MTAAPPYLRLLFWLKAKLVWRMYTRNTSAIIGLVFIALFFLPMSIGGGIGCYFGFKLLAPGYAEQLLRGVLLGAFLLWLVSPIIGYALMEDYDISKLLLYPLAPRQLLSGVVLGAAIDFGVLLLVPSLLAALIVFGHDPLAFALVALTLSAFLCHTIALSQGLGLAAAGILRSRRGRDVLIVLMPLVWITFYVGSQALSRRAVGYDWNRFLDSGFWRAMGYLPPGLAARAIGAAGQSEYAAAFGLLLVIGALAVASLWFAGWLVQLVYAGEYTGSTPKRRGGARAPAPHAAERPALDLRLPPVVEAIASKEIHYLRRDPAFKFFVMQMIYMLAVMGIGILYPWQHGHTMTQGSPVTLWIWFSVLVMMEAHLVFNIFGVEAGAAAVLFLLPGPRRHILLGKNLVMFGALSAANLVLIGVLTVLLKQLGQLLPLALWAALATALFISAGNLMSVWMPWPVVVRGWGMPRRSASRGLGYGLFHLLGLAVTGLFALPVLAALVLPAFWVGHVWYIVTVPLAVIYTAFGYLFTLHLAEQALSEREVEVIEKLRPTD